MVSCSQIFSSTFQIFLFDLSPVMGSNAEYSRWEKYNYLTEAGFDVGIAISGLIQTLIFAFSNGGDGISWTWWGNSIATQVRLALFHLADGNEDGANIGT